MDVDEVLKWIDHVDQGGKGTKGPNGENSGVLMGMIIDQPGAPALLVERYGSSTNDITISNLASNLIDIADNPTPETVGLIYRLLEKMPDWTTSGSWTINNLLLTIRTQTINDLPWDPPEPTPPTLAPFLIHSVGLEADDDNDNADTAVNILWNLHLWAEDRGGLHAVFNAEERAAFRTRFEEVGLEPGPILKSLGED